MMKALISNTRVVALVGKIYSDFPLILSRTVKLEVKEVYEVIDKFYKPCVKQVRIFPDNTSGRKDDDVYLYAYDTPCRIGATETYHDKQDFMVYEVVDQHIYDKLTDLMLEEWEQQEADYHLSMSS